MQNKMSRLVGLTYRLPSSLQPYAVSWLFGRIVPFLSTAGLHFEQVSHRKMVVSIRNRRKVQNHIKGVHATAMALLAETATGFVVGMNMPDDKIMLLKSMHIQYLKRSTGNMRAIATLTDEHIATIHTLEKAEINVPVLVSDTSGEYPIECLMIWAWIPKKDTR